jgi:hypothetical protein
MPEEEYVCAVAEVNSTYLKSITGTMKPCFPYNLEYPTDKASGSSFSYEGYIKAELRNPTCSYAIN